MDFKELDLMFEKMIKKLPEAKRKLVKKCGDKMYEKVIRNIKETVKEDTGNLIKGVTKAVGSRGGYSAVKPNYKIAPHSHLVENGYRIVKNGEFKGWAQGRFMYIKALEELAEELEADAESMLNELVGDIFD